MACLLSKLTLIHYMKAYTIGVGKLIQEVAKNIYSFGVTLPNSPLRLINAYVVKGENRTVLFDTGFNNPQSEAELLAGLSELSIDLADLEVVLTHLHSDHTGLVHLFSRAGCKIYASQLDGDYTNAMISGNYWDHINGLLDLYGLQADQIDNNDNPGFLNQPSEPFEFTVLTPGDDFVIGDYKFKILDLIGHTPGHIGFYDEASGILLSADTVLDPITPNITFWGFEHVDILGSYVNTLKQLKQLKINLILPTHRKIIYQPYERMTELIEHHNERLQEILDAMTPGSRYTVRDISAVLSWRIKADNWDEFPKSQKIFAAGETMAHLEHLSHTNCVEMTEDEGGTLYFTKLQKEIKAF